MKPTLNYTVTKAAHSLQFFYFCEVLHYRRVPERQLRTPYNKQQHKQSLLVTKKKQEIQQQAGRTKLIDALWPHYVQLAFQHRQLKNKTEPRTNRRSVVLYRSYGT